jgi:branched-chain amino acid transport system substrate-binding protein
MRLHFLLVAALLLIAGPAFSGGAAEAAEATVAMAVAGPMSGPNRAFGEQLQRGAQQAVDDINARGGVLGRKIGLQIGDDQSNPAKAPEIAKAFAAGKVQFVVGHFNSGVSIPVSLAYRHAGILQISPASTNPALTDRGLWNVFRVIGRDDQQGPLWADYAQKHFAGKKIALVDDGTVYGTGLTAKAQKALRDAGVRPVFKTSIEPGQVDYAKLTTRLKASKADLLMFGGLFTEGGALLRNMRDAGLTATMIGSDGLASAEFPRIGGEAVDGTLMTFFPRAEESSTARDVVAEFKDYKPDGYTLYAYASVQVYAQAIEKARSTDPKKVADVMHSGVLFHTVLGDVSFDRKGDRRQTSYVFYEWRKGADGSISYFRLP